MEQLSFEDIVGNMDYTAHSTAEKFLSNHSVTPTYAVEFFDRDKKQKLRWFEVNTEDEAKEKAEEKYREIQIIKVYVSNRTLKEIMELD
ncbi:group-specific phage protein [Bacillus thuringiensis serovar tolworthi]|uniref:Group-specific phage protein n=1 Tax=Bacillus thuringiensis subsp. tolworthi TaxID=1442 RepID=A0A9W3ZU64_BACTO|nr:MULTISPECIES: hypothetical protein [Bacillus cereus group]MRB06663.1 hypothetical protein [Bacillus thuringiensis]MRC50901.1 hypothetical protein [Bacillus thuringiensis]MRD28876.1 hypothetical protein [Bacillus thuringiensis]BAR83139.1 group-specific phage protein [Bacillus thuringiensis serovar tolworthi]